GLLWGVCALLGTLGACETSRNPGGVQRDLISPTIQLAGADTQDIKNGLNFSVTATDNLGLKDIQLTYSGGYINQTDSVFTSTVTSITLQEKINAARGRAAASASSAARPTARGISRWTRCSSSCRTSTPCGSTCCSRRRAQSGRRGSTSPSTWPGRKRPASSGSAGPSAEPPARRRRPATRW